MLAKSYNFLSIRLWCMEQTSNLHNILLNSIIKVYRKNLENTRTRKPNNAVPIVVFSTLLSHFCWQVISYNLKFLYYFYMFVYNEKVFLFPHQSVAYSVIDTRISFQMQTQFILITVIMCYRFRKNVCSSLNRKNASFLLLLNLLQQRHSIKLFFLEFIFNVWFIIIILYFTQFTLSHVCHKSLYFLQ